MLDVQYKKDGYGNYMVVKTEEESELAYGMKMHLNNKIKGLLDVELHITDNRMELYYNITSKQTIASFLERGQLKYEEIKEILKGIIMSIENGKEFLLSEDDFVLESEYIFIYPSTLEVNLCHYAGNDQDFTKQVGSFIEYLMNKVDYTDEKAVILIYGLYKISKEANGVLENLKEFINMKSAVPRKVIDEDFSKDFIKKKEKVEEIIIGKDDQTKIKIPRMQEKIKDTREVLCYSGITILAGILSLVSLIIIFISMWKMGIFTSITNIFGVVLISITIEVYLLTRLFAKKNKISKMKTVVEYIDPVQEKQRIDESNETICLSEDNETVLLNRTESKDNYKLRAEKPEEYQDIPVIEFPFFIGKLKMKVNCSIDNVAISRVHAKIELLKDKHYITDLNSTNGTYLNDLRLESNETRELHLDEKISFANVSYFFQKISK